MFDMILENYRKAAELTMKRQQDVLRSWTMQMPQMFGAQMFGLPFMGGPASASAVPGAAWLTQLSDAQKKWGETVTHSNKHRESLDAQYKAGVRTIEEAFSWARPRSAAVPPSHGGALEAQPRVPQVCGRVQTRDVQAAMEKLYEGWRAPRGVGLSGPTTRPSGFRF